MSIKFYPCNKLSKAISGLKDDKDEWEDVYRIIQTEEGSAMAKEKATFYRKGLKARASIIFPLVFFVLGKVWSCQILDTPTPVTVFIDLVKANPNAILGNGTHEYESVDKRTGQFKNLLQIALFELKNGFPIEVIVTMIDKYPDPGKNEGDCDIIVKSLEYDIQDDLLSRLIQKFVLIFGDDNHDASNSSKTIDLMFSKKKSNSIMFMLFESFCSNKSATNIIYFFSKALKSDRSDEFLQKLISKLDAVNLSVNKCDNTSFQDKSLFRIILENCKSEQVLEAFLDKFPHQVLMMLSPSPLEFAIEQDHSSAVILKILSIIAENATIKSFLGEAIPSAMRLERDDKEILAMVEGDPEAISREDNMGLALKHKRSDEVILSMIRNYSLSPTSVSGYLCSVFTLQRSDKILCALIDECDEESLKLANQKVIDGDVFLTFLQSCKADAVVIYLLQRFPVLASLVQRDTKMLPLYTALSCKRSLSIIVGLLICCPFIGTFDQGLCSERISTDVRVAISKPLT